LNEIFFIEMSRKEKAHQFKRQLLARDITVSPGIP
jgi:hypothetical protein